MTLRSHAFHAMFARPFPRLPRLSLQKTPFVWLRPFSNTSSPAETDLKAQPFLDQIDSIVHASDVVIFMKGRPEAPQCGFSRAAAQVLSQFPLQVAAVDVLEHPGIREGVKKYSSWPTIPQIFVKGEFLGGCDILLDMYRQGQLEALFKEKGILKAEETVEKQQ